MLLKVSRDAEAFHSITDSLSQVLGCAGACAIIDSYLNSATPLSVVRQIYVNRCEGRSGQDHFLGHVLSILSAAVLVSCAAAECCPVLAVASGD